MDINELEELQTYSEDLKDIVYIKRTLIELRVKVAALKGITDYITLNDLLFNATSTLEEAEVETNYIIKDLIQNIQGVYND
jgi:hypothetical protein